MLGSGLRLSKGQEGRDLSSTGVGSRGGQPGTGPKSPLCPAVSQLSPRGQLKTAEITALASQVPLGDESVLSCLGTVQG